MELLFFLSRFSFPAEPEKGIFVPPKNPGKRRFSSERKISVVQNKNLREVMNEKAEDSCELA